MKIAVWGINYAPETTGIGPHNTALCEFLRERGHDVRMLTSFSYYPAWRKLETDEGRIYRTDMIGGTPVHRCWHYVPRRASSLKRILHEFTFVAFSSLRFLALPKPDIVIVVSPPLLLGAAAWVCGALKNVPYVFHVQDLQPDSAKGLGMLKPGLFMKSLYGLESLAYRKATRVSGISAGMLEAFTEKGVPPSKQVYFPNTIVPVSQEISVRGAFRKRNGFSEDDFFAVHSGNLGMKHGLHTLVEAARHVKDPRIKIIICGEGAARDSLKEKITREGLRNVSLFPLQTEEDYRALLTDTDIGFIAQQSGSGKCFFPSKLLNVLSHAKPVLAVADLDSELARALDAGKFGVRVNPDDPLGLAEELDRCAAMPGTLIEWGQMGREFVKQFDRATVFASFETSLTAACERR